MLSFLSRPVPKIISPLVVQTHFRRKVERKGCNVIATREILFNDSMQLQDHILNGFQFVITQVRWV
jgi:hypothetical protein